MTDFAGQSLLEFFHDTIPSNPMLSKKKQTANDMALRDGKPMVVVNMGNGAYEIYPKSVAVQWKKGWVYDTEGALL